jgi:hypothetical protein
MEYKPITFSFVEEALTSGVDKFFIKVNPELSKEAWLAKSAFKATIIPSVEKGFS